MKNFYFLLILLFFSKNVFSQTAKIYTKKQEVVTFINHVGKKGIFTEIGTFRFIEIEKVGFGTEDEKFKSNYKKIQKYVPIEFGLSLNNVHDPQDFSNIQEADVENLSQKQKRELYPEDYLVKGSLSSLAGYGLILFGVIASTSSNNEDNQIISAGLGVLGFALVVDGWLKIGKSGKLMREERKKKN